jgi:uncharacterized protein DUF5916
MIPLLPILLLQAAALDSIRPRHATGLAAAVTVARVGPDARPSLDGRLDESAWALTQRISGLVQTDPDEGKPVSESTEVHILYDGEALYVGARLFDSEPQRIVSRLTRRDASTHSDEFRLLLDSYHDHRTAFKFIVNPAGVRSDVLIGEDGAYKDDSWDPVWQAATSVDSLGWIVEMRIPFTQLRFSRASEQVWGVQIERWIERKNERAMFPFVGKTEEGVASRFAHLEGLFAVAAPRRVELLPYVFERGRFERPEVAQDPFNDGSRYFSGAGADLKYGVSSSLTLDATINPDFGQVEVDPAYVNLTAFEQELQERRPFFIEGGDLFTFGGNGRGLVKFSDPPQFVYSRRIGHEPEGSADGDFVAIPENTTLLGAAKLTGRRASGWSVGLLDAVTAREWATVVDTTPRLRHHDEVEPLTNYFAGRLKRELRGGNTTLGVIASAVHRDLRTPALAELRSAAYDGGVDLFHRWGHNTYTIAASLGGSYLRGDPAAIERAQRNSNRYYQRPDAERFSDDPTRTTLSGMTGDMYVNRIAGQWNWSFGAGFASPGFEVNDFGFQKRVDRQSAGVGVRRRWTKPGRAFRQAIASLTYVPTWNYDGDPIQRKASAYLFGLFRNYWSLEINASYGTRVLDDRLTRGGPLAAKPAGWSASGELNTDGRKSVIGYFLASYTQTAAGSWSMSVLPQVTLRPSAALSMSIGPYYFGGREVAQYVTQVADPTAVATLGARYVFAELEQHSVDVSLRMNATFSPALSLQLYAQPFTFAGDYGRFKELRARRTYQFNEYGRDNGSTMTPGDPTVCGGAGPTECVGIDPDGVAGPAATFALYNPDFRTRSLRINGVLRWEYRLGSTLYVAWTQSRSAYFPGDGSFDPGRDLRRELLYDRPANVLLVKLSYWLSR